MNRLGRISVFTVAILGLSLAIGMATSHQVRAAVSALVTVSNTSANPVPTESVDASNAFQYDTTMGFAEQAVPIPAGKRLVIDFVAVNGDVSSLDGPIQPSVILESSLNGGNSANYYLEPAPSPVNIAVENQLQLAKDVKIYADTLAISTAVAGYSPNYFSLHISISGHLVPNS